jgi:large subunit ribosomal protein L29
MARELTELKELDLAALVQELKDTKHEALNLRFRNATGQLDNTAEIRKARRQIARINTLIREREIAEAEKVSTGKKN